MTRKQMLKVKGQWTRETIGGKPSNSSDLGRVSDPGGGIIGIAAHPNSQVVLADIGKHVTGDRNKLNVRDGDTSLLQRLSRGANIRRLAKIQVPTGRGPETALIADEQQLPIANDNAADADIRNLVRNAGVGHR